MPADVAFVAEHPSTGVADATEPGTAGERSRSFH